MLWQGGNPEVVRDYPSRQEPADFSTHMPSKPSGPIVELSGDPAVREAFFDKLERDGLLTPTPGHPGWVSIHASSEDIAKRWSEAATAVAEKEGRHIVGGVVASDNLGNLQLGAGRDKAEVYLEQAKTTFAAMPENHPSRYLVDVLYHPSKANDLAKVEQAVQALADNKVSQMGRPPSAMELLHLAAAVDYAGQLMEKTTPALEELQSRIDRTLNAYYKHDPTHMKDMERVLDQAIDRSQDKDLARMEQQGRQSMGGATSDYSRAGQGMEQPGGRDR